MVQIPSKPHTAQPVNRKGSPDDVPALTATRREPNTKKVPLQVRVEAELAREYRVFCASRDLDLSEAFAKMFEFYRDAHGA